MGFFIDPNERVSMADDAGNTVYYKAKMDRATRAAVNDELLRLQVTVAAPGEGKEASFTATVGLERQALTLLKHNVVRWEGPDFTDERGRPIPCTKQMIERTDPSIPLFDRVVADIKARNEPRRAEPQDAAEAADPNF